MKIPSPEIMGHLADLIAEAFEGECDIYEIGHMGGTEELTFKAYLTEKGGGPMRLTNPPPRGESMHEGMGPNHIADMMRD